MVRLWWSAVVRAFGPSHLRESSCRVHPRVAMSILRHSQIAVTMDIYSQVSSESIRQALVQLGSALGDDPE